MKLYNLDDAKKLVENSENRIIDKEYDEDNTSSYSLIEFDDAKTKILKYVLYKKRSENEIKRKFEKIYSEEIIEDVIDNLKEKGYINDLAYIERTVNEFIALKNLSIKEIKYKLISKGIKFKDIESYFESNYEVLLDYEKKSAKNLVKKKINTMEENDIKIYLIKKGYKEESIKEAI